MGRRQRREQTQPPIRCQGCGECECRWGQVGEMTRLMVGHVPGPASSFLPRSCKTSTPAEHQDCCQHAENSLASCCQLITVMLPFLGVSVIECLERSCSNVRVEGPVFQAFIDSRCFGAGWPPLPEARPRWVARKRERRPAAKLLARRSPRPRAVHHRHLYFHLNAWRSSLKPTLRHKRWNI